MLAHPQCRATEPEEVRAESSPVISHSAEPVLPVFSGVRASLPSSTGSGIIAAPPFAACNAR